jgi:hypothetical protein
MNVVARDIKLAAEKATRSEAPRLRWPLIWTCIVTLLLVGGAHAHLERYITPLRGTGYWLGIAGGSMMLLLLLYSARKRYTWLRWMGGIPAWFEFHMVMGVLGPVLVLFHANFQLGATNSNVALVCMLLVSGSGVIGRYIYTRLHAHMDGTEDTLEQLRAVGERLRTQQSSMAMLPGLVAAIDDIERRLIQPPRNPLLRLPHLVVGPLRTLLAKLLVRRAISQSLARVDARKAALMARHAARLTFVTRRYAYRRFEAGRRLAEFQLYERLFSWWHVLHIPLFFMLLIAGIVHVIAVNIY